MEKAPGSTLPSADREAIREAKNVLSLFAHTVTAIRLYPSRHEKAVKFGDEFYNALSRFLERRGNLEIGIEENAFTLGAEVLYRDDGGLKNLPYLFFKDGMRGLTFLPGLHRQEFGDFLDVVKAGAELSPEESDIVDALWELDLEHIRYHAPEEFLMAKIAPALQPEEIHIDRDALYAGRIDLDPADTAAFNARILEIGRTRANTPTELADLFAELDQSDLRILDSALAMDRNSSSDREFIETLDEILFLEERNEAFVKILEFLPSYFQTLLERAELAETLRLMDVLHELRTGLVGTAPERAEAAGRTLDRIMQDVDLPTVRDLGRPERIADPRRYFEFLARFGSRFLTPGAEAIEAVQVPAWRTAGVEYLRTMIREYPAETAALAQDRKPYLTKTLIALLAERGDKKSILALMAIARGENPEIRLDAVRTLGRLTDDLARKAVLEFLHDPDGRVRLAAVKSARLEIDRKMLDQVLKAVPSKEFLARSPEEKAAVLSALGRTDTAEAAAALQSILQRRSLFNRKAVGEMRLLAVAGLAVMTRPEAGEALKAGAKSPKRPVAQACADALRRFGRPRGGAER